MQHDAPPAPISILVVEDEPVTRRKICMAVESHPALKLAGALDTATAAQEWLARRQVDVLLTDLGLPDGSGLDVIRACAQHWPETDIMVITMSSDEANVLASIEAGAAGYVLKESSKLDLLQVILDLCAGGSPMSPAVARMVIARIRNGGKAAVQEAVTQAPSLSKREAAILELIAKGNTYGDVAKQLALSVGTVQSHIKHIYSKLQVHSRSAAVYEAQRRGYLQMSEGMTVVKRGRPSAEAAR